MLLVADVREDKRIPDDGRTKGLWGIDRLNVPRSVLPAITHVDDSARIQTVDEERNPLYHRLIHAFERRTGCPVIVNTSFNVRGEPIVGSPADAYRCFLATNIDVLALGHFLLHKEKQLSMSDVEQQAAFGPIPTGLIAVFRRLEEIRPMSLISVNWQPDRKTLAEFSEAWMVALGMFLTPLMYFRGHAWIAVACWVLALVGRAVGLVRPMWMKPIYLGMTLLTFPIGWVISNLTLALLYYLVFTPVSWFFRLIGRDTMKRRFDPNATSYWDAYSPEAGGQQRYLRPF